MFPESLDSIPAADISFDLGFQGAELANCGLQMPQTFGRLCTMHMARRKSVASNARLATIASALRIPALANAHRAIVDAGGNADETQRNTVARVRHDDSERRYPHSDLNRGGEVHCHDPAC